MNEAEVAEAVKNMTDKEKKKYMKHVKARERTRKRREKRKRAACCVVSSIKNGGRLLQSAQLENQFMQCMSVIWSSEHNQFFYYNVKTLESRWTKPALLGPTTSPQDFTIRSEHMWI